MSFDVFLILVCSILGLLAHGSRRVPWLEWLLRIIIFGFFVSEASSALAGELFGNQTAWQLAVLKVLALFTLALLFINVRKCVSVVFSVTERIVSGQAFFALYKKASAAEAFLAERVFIPNSIPHMVAFFVFINAVAFMLGGVDPNSAKMPMLPVPLPVPMDQLFSYNGFGLVFVSVCGVGILVARKPKEVAARLAWAKPTWVQVGIGVGLIVFAFTYDYVWSLFTHQMPGDLGGKLSNYNAGTFTAGGGFGSSIILALAVALCAGIGEETLIRGALQPAFGILPAAILHGLLHGQFSHAPLLMVQVAGWSTCMGIVKRYTNTTTTIIGHAGFNLATTFLFAFNP